jgi:hypothetical protein
MGNYNWYSPIILGEEWAPIRDEDLFLTPVVNTLEVGHGLTLAAPRTLTEGRFYAHQLPSSDAVGQVFQIAVYPRGFEDLSGPIRSVVIPVNNGGVTGNATFSPAASLADALADPSDGFNLTLSGGTPADANADLYFAVNQYSQLLFGKRVLAVNLLYTATSSTLADFDGRASIMPPAVTDGILYASTSAGTIVAPEAGPGRPEISRIPFGEVGPFFSGTPSNTVQRLPWIYSDLQRFEISASGRITVRLAGAGNASGTALFYLYAALEVIFCDEQRLAVSGVAFGPPTANAFYGLRQRYVYGANPMPMRAMSNLALNPVLPAGVYTVVLSSPETGIDAVQDTPYPILNALRQLYETPPHPALQVNIPKPAQDHLGETFTANTTMVLPQISLHASGGTLTEPHAYGRQVAAHVYGTVTATQDVYDDISGAANTYPQVRFYARRHGDTTVPLTLTGVGGLSGSTVSITPAAFDALPEIADGWAEVTLRFAAPPSMGAVAGNPAWTWSAAGENAGNRWEVMGACAPAVSGVPGNLYNLAPAPHQLGVATYQPPAGDTVELTWMPQGVGSPYVSGATIDATSDAVLLFSQDPPAVTGLTLTPLTQTVTGIGLNCATPDCCIPSGISYQRLTWNQTSLAASGFGAYELQRWDTVTLAFETVMLSQTVTGTGFNDFEARVGLPSVYRMRVLNVYNFAGAWSGQVTGAPPTPGVTGSCPDATGALIFTGNADQSGLSNAAYIMQWSGTPEEAFSLPEGDQVAFLPMYRRDGVAAFHGTERGLESFARTLLVNAAAIDPARLADTTTLRDLAWRDLPYVCVRDDIGDRWYANVRVPAVAASGNRTKYLARVEIVELTRTPAPVQP